MAEPAKKIQVEPVGTEGLDQLFQVELDQEIQSQDQQVQMDHITLMEGAKRLGLSRRYVHKLITEGRIPAFRDSRGRWLIKLDQGQIQIQDHQDQADQMDLHLEQSQIRLEEPGEGQQTARLLDMIESLQSQVNAAQNQLQAASYRNGYLEAQLQERDSQIKLLTDSQSKHRGWWHKCMSWFGGSDR